MTARSRSCWKALFASVSIAATIAACAADQESPSAGGIPLQAAISHSRQFVVWAPEREIGTLWAAWCESAAADIAALLRASTPYADASPIYLHLIPGSKTARMPVKTVQGYPDGRLQQRIFAELDKCSQSEVLAGLSRMICNRHAIARQSAARRRRRLAAVPDWLAFGVALNISASNRAHMRSLAAGLWRRGEIPRVDECLAMNPEAAGRATPREEAIFYAFMRWLRGLSDFESIVDMAIGNSSRGDSVTRLDLLQAAQEFESLREIELSWELALARIEKIDTLVRRRDPLEALADLNGFIAGIFEIYSELSGLRVDGGNVVRYRSADWCEELTQAALAGLQEFLSGPDPETRSLARSYAEAFRMLGEYKEKDAKSSASIILGDGVTEGRIAAAFAAAEQARNDLAARYRRYKSYLDRIENKLYNRRQAGGYSPSKEEVEYLDSVEQGLFLPARR